MNASKVVIGVLAGAAVGALVGLLFAPHKGSKTRKNIMRKGEAYAQDLKDKTAHLVESVTDKLRTSKRETNGSTEDARMKLTEPVK